MRKKSIIKTLKFITLSFVAIGFVACEGDLVEDIRNRDSEDPVVFEDFTSGTLDLSNYVAVGASFTAGFSDGGLFIETQENSFPNILANQFTNAGVTSSSFTQPLMDDNTGGILVNGNVVNGYRLVFGGAGPVPLNSFLESLGQTPPPITTEATNNIGSDFNNFGIPGAKSFHIVTPGYGAFNPFYTRIASSATSTILADAIAQGPTFFTLSEMGGNDVLGFATSGGTGVDQTGNLDPATYGNNDITDPQVFANALNNSINALTANGSKGLLTNVPFITDLPHFTTVPFNPLDPNDPDSSFGDQVATLNAVFGALNPIFQAIDPSRQIVFSETEPSPVVIHDESLADISVQIEGALNASTTFPAFLQSLGINPSAAPIVANLLGTTYGQSRQATEADLFVLPSSSVIGEVNTQVFAGLVAAGLSQQVAGQFSVEGITLPLSDNWVLIPDEQNAIENATIAYNNTIEAITNANPNVGLVDLNQILADASMAGLEFDEFTLTTDLVFGGLVSLDGIHLTSRGYALMANKFLEALDTNFGSNFIASGNVAKASGFQTNYSSTLQ